jgi:hypothetical protein
LPKRSATFRTSRVVEDQQVSALDNAFAIGEEVGKRHVEGRMSWLCCMYAADLLGFGRLSVAAVA